MKNKCLICDSSMLNSLSPLEMMFGTRVSYKYVYCRNCDTVQFCDVEKESQNDYPENYYSFRETNVSLWERVRSSIYNTSVKGVFDKLFLFNRIAAKIFDEKSAYAVKGIIESSNSILDIGCGSGDLIYSFSKIFKDKKFVGLDSFIAKSKERSENCSILKEDVLNHKNCYDLILLNHSFEHMDNPYNICSKLTELLNPGGIICIRIPVCDSFFYKKYGVNWVQLDAPRHKFIYSNKSFDILMKKSNLKVIHSYSDSKTFSYMASEMYKQNISLVDPESFFQNRIKQLFNFSYYKHIFKGKKIVERMNEMNFGDQRVYIIIRDNLKEVDC